MKLLQQLRRSHYPVPESIHRMRLRRVGMYRCATQCRPFPQLRFSSAGINRCGKRAARWTSIYTRAEFRLMGVAECIEVSP